MTRITTGMQRKLQRMLEECYHCYTVQDIIDLVKEGKMQSFVEKDSWAVTQILDFPRRRMLECIWAVGDIEDAMRLEHRVEDFAIEIGATVIRAFGREGFKKFADMHGWKTSQRVYYKEIR